MTTHRPTETPAGRPLGVERAVVLVVGLLALLAGVAALAVATGWLGRFRARRPVLDPLAVQWWNDFPQIAIPAAIVLGVLLLVAGVWWMLRALAPEPRPDVRLETTSAGTLTVTSAALTEAVRSDAESVTGVQRAHVRMAGSERNPALRLTLTLREGTDVRQVWEELDDKVLSRARRTLDRDSVPTAVRLRLDRAPRQRVR